MVVRRLRVSTAFLLAPLALAACGDGGGSSGSGSPSARREATVTGVEVTGNVASGAPQGGSTLVFARTSAKGEAVSVGLLGPDGEFTLSALPAGSLELVFLNDTASDGVIDKGDPIAVLANPSLRDLQEGDRVRAQDVQLDFGARRATAASIDVAHSGAAAPAPATATPTAG
jgi:hypothetical protein